jgi:hypothetical protein
MQVQVHTNWRVLLRRTWSVRLALFWGALNGAVLGLAALADILNPWLFIGLNIVGYGAIAVARLLKQPGADL